ncbi:hypothetical protein B0T18DRAFT_399245 [Schizothecium vesticola]|uniref:Uncharacterized protein n=1 Tax=Schizothecium vesticola TaxID=314040 RepID=A0AA40FAX8_9PEZI|nr:hypothetical protein B0T18DRAFT_399245 [Schizothecium vesticola]
MQDIQGDSGSVFIGGSYTTLAKTPEEVLNTMYNPAVIAKARVELGRVTGNDRSCRCRMVPSLRMTCTTRCLFRRGHLCTTTRTP